ncbi:MAG TPA: Ig-like domain-containing protein [Gemmatimonadaceae bacterium]
MKLLRDLPPQLALAGIVALQISCRDSSGPDDFVASLSANSATTLMAAPGAPVEELPSVVVRDANGNPISGVRVTFAVASGGGSVTGDHVTSDASGIATVGSWTLGPTEGINTLIASAGSFSVTFTANGADPCGVLTVHTLGSTTDGQLSKSDCKLNDGSFVDFYKVSIPTAGTYIFSQTSSVFDTYLALLTATGSVIAINDDINSANNVNSQIKALLPVGTFIIAANSFDADTTGSYTLTSAASTAEVTNCEDVFVVLSISSAQSLQTSDCNTAGIYADEYLIFLPGGQTITASMSSSAVDSYLEILDGASTTILASNDNIDGTTQNARLTFTPASTGFYVIRARSSAAGMTGAYSFGIQ